jgi:acyl-CoA thioester hydrolase
MVSAGEDARTAILARSSPFHAGLGRRCYAFTRAGDRSILEGIGLAFVASVEEADFLAAIGITPAYLKANARGMAAVDQHTRYKEELHAGALIRVTSELLEIKPKTVRFRHRMYNAETGVEVAVLDMVGVHLDTTTRRSVPLPADILEHAQARATP